ncbi:DUF3515 domain-containing protein [Nocardia bhagyanarayanae]|uniref:Uncharacterized protein DUF3515 n=1 Tax=Nocardia bhagyanarayanae TaxID=1215925 RepID=A0A543FC64_9NOCA|nr:DUF3515 domain-containing protein [Nocardia bhagyanarayanae]TQM31336.1 uncharacterized protein DUF3515 [Nocardia bhagyanarayanae]
MAADSSDSDSAKGQEPTGGQKPTDLCKGGAGETTPGPAEKISATEQPAATAEIPTAKESRAADDAEATSQSPADDKSETTGQSRATDQPETPDTDGPRRASGESDAKTDEEPGAAEKARDAAKSESDESRPYPPALIATAVALPVVLVVAVLVAAVLARRLPTEREPLVLGPVPAPAATGEACTKLLPALPADLGEFTKSTLVEPAPPATRAWQRPDGGDAIVLRCGLDRPLEFHRASPLQIVNDVQWFEARDDAAKASTWFAVDRETYIALTVPDGSGPTPLQEVSDTITANLPAKPLDPGPLPN